VSVSVHVRLLTMYCTLFTRYVTPEIKLPTQFSQPPYLHNLISIQRPRSRPTRSSSVVTLARPPSSSSLKITYRSFRWNQLPWSRRQPHSDTSSSTSNSPIPSPITSSSSEFLIHHSVHPWLPLSLPVWNLPVSQILPPYFFLQDYRTIARTVSSELLGFCF